MSTRPMIELRCKMCGSVFSRSKREIERQVRAGRDPSQFFCSRGCSCRWGNGILTSEQRVHRSIAIQKSQPIATAAARDANRKGTFTYYLNKARHRGHRFPGRWAPSDLTESYLQQVWDAQNGCCAWTQIPMIMCSSPDRNNGLYAASLDRIDSSKGYVQGNVQFVLQPLNLAKGNRPDTEFIKFITHIMNLDGSRPTEIVKTPART